jgi:site-specific DNA-methyltransferase (cytosine-N4-specific)
MGWSIGPKQEGRCVTIDEVNSAHSGVARPKGSSSATRSLPVRLKAGRVPSTRVPDKLPEPKLPLPGMATYLDASAARTKPGRTASMRTNRPQGSLPMVFDTFTVDDNVDWQALLRSGSSALFNGDALRALDTMPSNAVQAVVTSPPYWSLRDYGIEGQIGLEASVHDFVQRLVVAFRSVRRVLRDDGAMWLNIGDSYTSGGRTWRAPDRKNPARFMSSRPPTPHGLKPKDLIGVPWRLAFALQDDGWYLRSDNVWDKPNCQPESVRDRPTRSHEYVFMLTKSEQYFYDVDAVRGPNSRRLRSVWSVPTKSVRGINGTHSATFPYDLVEPCVRLTTRPGDVVLDPFNGAGTTSLVAANEGRRFVGVELNPMYTDLARHRLIECGHHEGNKSGAIRGSEIHAG